CGANDDEDPQSVERGVLGLVERLEGQDLEPVGREARDHEAEADGIRAFRQRCFASSLDDALCALRHSAGPEWPGVEIEGPRGAAGRARSSIPGFVPALRYTWVPVAPMGA